MVYELLIDLISHFSTRALIVLANLSYLLFFIFTPRPIEYEECCIWGSFINYHHHLNCTGVVIVKSARILWWGVQAVVHEPMCPTLRRTHCNWNCQFSLPRTPFVVNRRLSILWWLNALSVVILPNRRRHFCHWIHSHSILRVGKS